MVRRAGRRARPSNFAREPSDCGQVVMAAPGELRFRRLRALGAHDFPPWCPRSGMQYHPKGRAQQQLRPPQDDAIA
jgi:hypothetical protein